MQYRLTIERTKTHTRFLTLQITAPHLHFPHHPETDETDIQINITHTQPLPAYEETTLHNTVVRNTGVPFVRFAKHLTTTNLLTTLCGINQHGPRFPVANQTQLHLHTDCKECQQILQTHQHTNTPNQITENERYFDHLIILNTPQETKKEDH